MEQSLGKERNATNQQGDDGLTYLMKTGGQASEVSSPIPEMEESATYLLNAHEKHPVHQQSCRGRSNDSLLNGGEAVPRKESISIQEPGTSQLVNGQHQLHYLQSAQANGLSHLTQEMGMDKRQRQDRQEVPYPIQETAPFAERTPGENESLDKRQRQDRQEVPYPIQETAPFAERTPGENENLPLCHQLLNGADINGVSSTGEGEQAVEHTCSRQELQIWKQKLDRQADVTSTTFVLEINT